MPSASNSGSSRRNSQSSSWWRNRHLTLSTSVVVAMVSGVLGFGIVAAGAETTTGNQTIEVIGGQTACDALGGTLGTDNLYTDWDNGTFGDSGSTAENNSPPNSSPPFANFSGGDFYTYYDINTYGRWSIVSNLTNARNEWQHHGDGSGLGIHDPVNGITGYFFHIDPLTDVVFAPSTIAGLTPGNQYQVSWYVSDAEWSTSGAKATMEVWTDDGTGQVLAYQSGEINNTASGGQTDLSIWERHTMLFTATTTTLDVEITFKKENGDPIDSGSGRDVHLDEISIRQCESADLTIDKALGTVDVTGGSDPAAIDEGDTVAYSFMVENTGNITQYDAQITDPLLNGGAPFGHYAGDCVEGIIPVLLPGESFTCTATAAHTLTAGNISAGSVANTAAVSGAGAAGGTLTEFNSDSELFEFEPPVAGDVESLGNPAGSTVTMNVLGDISDPDGDLDPSTLAIVGADPVTGDLVVPGEGTWTIDPATGAITFTPEASFNGDPTPIQYTVADSLGQVSPPADVTVDYLPELADDESLGNAPGSTVTIDVVGNDPTVDIDPTTVAIVGEDPSTGDLVVAGEGTWSVDPTSGAITFTPEAGFTGNPTPIDYTAEDAAGNVAPSAEVVVGYTPEAEPDESLGNAPGTAVTIDVVGNDPSVDIDPTTVAIVGEDPSTGDLVVAGEGTWSVDPATGAITFTPEPGFINDPSPIEYTAEDSLGQETAPVEVVVGYTPVLEDDESLGNTPGDPVTLDVVGNDPSVDIDPTTVAIVGADPSTGGLVVPGEGTWSVNPTTGAITFTPEPGFINDPTPIEYTAQDDEGNMAAPAEVVVGYIPVLEDDESLGNAPGTAVTLDVVGNDPSVDIDPTTVEIVGADPVTGDLVVPGEGTWSVDPTTGAITFTPEPGFIDDPTPITYTAEDTDGNVAPPANVVVDYGLATTDDESLGNTPGDPVTLDVLTNDPTVDIDPTTVAIVGADPSTGGLVVPGEGTWSVNPTTGAITFTPEPGFINDPTPIEYTAQDDEGNMAAPAEVVVGYIPVLEDDESLANPAGSPVTIDVLGNDPSVDIDPSTVAIVGEDPSTGDLVVAGEGTWSVDPTTGAITFTPEDGFVGDPTPITYTAEDTDGNVAPPAEVVVGYGPTLAPDESLGNTPGDSVTIDVVGNDPSVDIDPTTVAIVGADPSTGDLVIAGEGTWSVDPTTGAITFTPESGFIDNPTPIEYTAADVDGVEATPVEVVVGYTPVAEPDESLDNPSGSVVTIDVLTNDPTVDIDPTTVAIVGADPSTGGLVVPGEGTWSVDPVTGEITFTPESGFTGNPTPIEYIATDVLGVAIDPQTVTITYVQPSAPVLAFTGLAHMNVLVLLALTLMMTGAILTGIRRRFGYTD